MIEVFLLSCGFLFDNILKSIVIIFSLFILLVIGLIIWFYCDFCFFCIVWWFLVFVVLYFLLLLVWIIYYVKYGNSYWMMLLYFLKCDLIRKVRDGMNRCDELYNLLFVWICFIVSLFIFVCYFCFYELCIMIFIII